jgi:hypothetical protein
MWQTTILGFLAGVLGANGVPHFVRGITKESYPCLLGNSPIPNLIGGWGSFVLAAFVLYWTDVGKYPLTSMVSGALGVLLMGLFHAAGGAVGRRS